MTYKKQKESAVLRNDVYQSNTLVQARKQFDLLGMKIFMLGLRGLNPHLSGRDKFFDEDFEEMFISTSRLTELFGNTWYLSKLKPACKRLFDAIVEFNDEDGGFALYPLFRKLEYIPHKGLYLRFEDALRPYILDLLQSKGYTRINVEYLFNLSSLYAMRLLELLLQYQNIKPCRELMEIRRTLTVEELRFALNVPEGAYLGRIDHFKKFVLDDPINEINKRTPYVVRYEALKEGRSIVAFMFVMDTCNVPPDEYNCKFKRNKRISAQFSLSVRIRRTVFPELIVHKRRWLGISGRLRMSWGFCARQLKRIGKSGVKEFKGGQESTIR